VIEKYPRALAQPQEILRLTHCSTITHRHYLTSINFTHTKSNGNKEIKIRNRYSREMKNVIPGEMGQAIQDLSSE